MRSELVWLLLPPLGRAQLHCHEMATRREWTSTDEPGADRAFNDHPAVKLSPGLLLREARPARRANGPSVGEPAWREVCHRFAEWPRWFLLREERCRTAGVSSARSGPGVSRSAWALRHQPTSVVIHRFQGDGIDAPLRRCRWRRHRPGEAPLSVLQGERTTVRIRDKKMAGASCVCGPGGARKRLLHKP